MLSCLRVSWLMVLCLLVSGGCQGDVEVHQLLVQITSEAPAGDAVLTSVQIRLVGADTHFPVDVADPRFNLHFSPSANPVTSRLTVAIDASMVDGDMRLEVLGLGDSGVLTRYEGAIDVQSKGVFAVHLTRVPVDCDLDGDGFLDCDISGCCEDSASPFSDCHPQEASAHPWATEDPCELCDDVLDQDCDGQDLPCVDEDGDGVADCRETTCGAGDPLVAPGLPDVCDGIDNDCDGEVDSDYSVHEAGKVLKVGAACGLGACQGVVQCANSEQAICKLSVEPVDEICGDGVDNDCDGVVDNQCATHDMDGDGVPVEEDCNDLDSGAYPGAQEACCPAQLRGNPGALALCDKDCDAQVTYCADEDVDADGFVGADDCDPVDPTVYAGAPEKCGDGIDQDCFAGDLPCAGIVDVDADGWPDTVDCDDEDPAIHPGASEACDGQDNDCDGLVDEGNPYVPAESPCSVNQQQGECRIGQEACDHSGPNAEVICFGEVSPEAESCDAMDNDCDGSTDEDFDWEGGAIGQPCDGVGACGAGVVECATGGPGATCSTNQDGSKSEQATEICDDLDNDCDGELNEDLHALGDSSCKVLGLCGAPEADVKATCNPDTTGTWICDYGGVPGYEAGPESLCDGLDENCDGDVDESFSVGQGCDGADADVCFNGVLVCADDPSSTTCFEEGGILAELCDGEDNDCDGVIDEGFEAVGSACDGTDSDQCQNGFLSCKPNGSGTQCKESIVNLKELCDGVDNDCDGATDEAFPTLGEACDGPDSDGCANGAWTCGADGKGTVCVNESVVDLVELCDGKDNDCDGQTDEGFEALSCGLGSCAHSVNACVDGVTQTCDPMAGAAAEICDGLDNDCDGETDEALDDLACGLGPCAHTVAACVEGVPQACNPLQGAGPETCDNVDNDCNGATDDGLGEVLCGEGVCAHTIEACTDGVLTPCDAFDGAGVEVCDGADNDCDGATDEQLPTITCGTGECENTVSGCVDGAAAACAPLLAGVDEVCDDLDNDCDGATDEGLALNVCGDGICETSTCSGGLFELPCVPLDNAGEEICGDGLDNNCDDIPDNYCCPAGFALIADGQCEKVGVTSSDQVFVPQGTFTMGCTNAQNIDWHGPADNVDNACGLAGFPQSLPAHQVTLSAFAIDRREATVSEFTACVSAGACSVPGTNDKNGCVSAAATYGGSGNGAENLPINFVKHGEATTFCAWAGKRLCTEAEWEKAARGTGTAFYPWGYATPTCDEANFTDCGGQVAVAGKTQAGASPYGALDMAGNVSEWVADVYASDYYASSPAADPTGASKGAKFVYRGGHASSSKYSIRVDKRFNAGKGYACHRVGIRCCSDTDL